MTVVVNYNNCWTYTYKVSESLTEKHISYDLCQWPTVSRRSDFYFAKIPFIVIRTISTIAFIVELAVVPRIIVTAIIRAASKDAVRWLAFPLIGEPWHSSADAPLSEHIDSQYAEYSEVSIQNLRSILYKFHLRDSGRSCNADLRLHPGSFER